jgi:hypothetical protein
MNNETIISIAMVSPSLIELLNAYFIAKESWLLYETKAVEFGM